MNTIPAALSVLALMAVAVCAVTACSPITVLNALSPAGDTRSSKDVAYAAGPRNKLDIYLPEHVDGTAPVVVFFYGGNWVDGNRADYAFVGRALASRGIIAVVPDYRLYPEVSYPTLLDDPSAAVAWTARDIARYGGDPARLFVMGHSAGAYNAAMVALDPRRLAKFGMKPSMLSGLIGLAGPYDFIPIENKTTRPVFHFPNTPLDSQPVSHVSASAPRTLLIAPVNDDLVNPKRNTGGLARKLRENGVAVTERYFDGVSHTTLVGSIAVPLRRLGPTLDEVEAFVKGK
ncbi:acetyl esterase/lipase [Janthinobacterium sp. CG_23.3]|uniref:alpha/beta hydrolase n=1 Tax=Janthinobacterium sp. CG_23.3 TaxID=3349634 RepID=UPI0038D4F714